MASENDIAMSNIQHDCRNLFVIIYCQAMTSVMCIFCLVCYSFILPVRHGYIHYDIWKYLVKFGRISEIISVTGVMGGQILTPRTVYLVDYVAITSGWSDDRHSSWEREMT